MIKKVISIIIGLSLPIILAEITLQILDKPNSEVKIGWKYQGNHKDEINQLGYRGKKISYSDSDTVILLIGDSQTEAEAMDFENLPENLLQQKLGKNYKVFSIGAAGYGNDQQLLALKNYFKKYKAHKVILWQTFDNDLWNNTFPTHMPDNGQLKPTFILKNEGLIYPSDSTGSIKQKSFFKISTLLSRIICERPDNQFNDFLPQPYKSKDMYDGKYNDILDPKNGHSRNENFTNEKNHYSVRFFPISERTKYSIKLTNLLLKEINKVCLKNNSEFYIFNVDLKDFNPNFTQDTTVYKINNKFYFSSLSTRNRNMEHTNEDLKWLKVPLYIDDWAVSIKDPHLNKNANEIVMKFVADSLIQK